ncbi:MAG: response regulator [Pseudomonadota bacterium]
MEIIDRSHQTVFIVSGDEVVRSGLEQVLYAQGIYAITFETAAAYLQYPERDAPGCVILDVVLPDMCGLDLQLQLAGACPPVLFVTQQADVVYSVRALKAGALDFLTTPLQPHTMLRAVRAALDLDRIMRVERAREIELRQRLATLTHRERQVLPLVAGGSLNKQSAAELGVTEITIQVHRRRIMQKMQAASFADLVRMAYFLGIPALGVSRPARSSSRIGGDCKVVTFRETRRFVELPGTN